MELAEPVQENMNRIEGNDFTHRKVMVSWQNRTEEAVLRQQWGWQLRCMQLPKINFDILLPLLPVQVLVHQQPATNRFP